MMIPIHRSRITHRNWHRYFFGTALLLCKQNSIVLSTIERKQTVKEPSVPKGTIALLVFFVIFTLALWGNAYLIMLSRGATQ